MIAIGLFGGKWVTIRTVNGAKADHIDRLYAVLKSNGIKAKVEDERHSKKLLVKAKDEAAANALADEFEKEL